MTESYIIPPERVNNIPKVIIIIIIIIAVCLFPLHARHGSQSPDYLRLPPVYSGTLTGTSGGRPDYFRSEIDRTIRGSEPPRCVCMCVWPTEELLYLLFPGECNLSLHFKLGS
jgi:hypothetical protein